MSDDLTKLPKGWKPATFQHTPGPWRVSADDPTSIFAGRHYVAETYTDGEANAPLVAAAPDMLEALQDALMVLQSAAAADPTWTGAASARDKVLAAINKAAG